jgi:hypothetical protein
MRTLFLFIVASALCLTAKGVENDFPYPPNNLIVFTNTPVISNITATVTFTNSFETKYAIQHTIQFFSTAAGTNAVTASLDGTIDGVNWYTLVNNVTVTNNVGYSTNIVGKFWQMRCRVTAASTNDTFEWLYMAQ